MLFLVPELIAIIGMVYFVFNTDEDKKWKILGASLVAISLLLRWIPDIGVPWGIPVVIQLLVACWMVIYWKMNA
jgi:hypothetical protein